MSKNYMLTEYIFPIKPTTPFWNGIYFDNPRTEEEIKNVAEILRKINSGDDYKCFCYSENKLKIYLDKFFNTYKYDIDVQNYINSDIYKKLSISNNLYTILASMCVIVRFDIDDSTNTKCLGEYDLLVPSYEKTIRILDFLCFTSFTNEAHTRDSFLVKTFLNNRNYLYEKSANSLILFNLYTCTIPEIINDCESHFGLPFKKVLEIINFNLEKIKKYENDYKFNYIAEMIGNYQNIEYDQMKIVTLVSIFELLVTHKPDANRYNIEESIRKMFSNRILTILYLNNKNINIKAVKKELLSIYDLRSNISHGNFNDINSCLAKLRDCYIEIDGFRFDSDDDYTESYLLSRTEQGLRNYLKILLNKYIDDDVLFDILKD